MVPMIKTMVRIDPQIAIFFDAMPAFIFLSNVEHYDDCSEERAKGIDSCDWICFSNR